MKHLLYFQVWLSIFREATITPSPMKGKVGIDEAPSQVYNPTNLETYLAKTDK
jgi:hypothetical protein